MRRNILCRACARVGSGGRIVVRNSYGTDDERPDVSHRMESYVRPSWFVHDSSRNVLTRLYFDVYTSESNGEINEKKNVSIRIFQKKKQDWVVEDHRIQDLDEVWREKFKWIPFEHYLE